MNDEQRIRAGWRVLIQIFLTTGLVLAIGSSFLVADGRYQFFRMEFSMMLAVILVLSFATRILDRRKFRDLGVDLREKSWWSDLGFGLFLGLFQTLAFLLAAWRLGWVTIEPAFLALGENAPLQVAVLMDILAFVCVAVMEELLRAYQVRNVAEGTAHGGSKWQLGLLAGTLVASAMSVVMHLNQQGPGFWSYVFLRSLIFCLGFCLTGRVALAVGLHFAWDFLTTTVVSLGGTGGITAAVLYAAPLTLAGNQAFRADQFTLLGLALQVPILVLMLVWVRVRSGKLSFRQGLTAYPSKPLRSKLTEDHKVRPSTS